MNCNSLIREEITKSDSKAQDDLKLRGKEVLCLNHPMKPTAPFTALSRPVAVR
jgi:hypothetical protein